MSSTLSQTEINELDEMRRLFGEIEGEPQVDASQREGAGFLAHIRGLLAEATHEESVSLGKLAEILGTSKAAVSRHLRSDGDIRASTMWAFAKALNRRWVIDLVPEKKAAVGHNHFIRTPAAASSSSSTYTAPQGKNGIGSSPSASGASGRLVVTTA